MAMMTLPPLAWAFTNLVLDIKAADLGKSATKSFPI